MCYKDSVKQVEKNSWSPYLKFHRLTLTNLGNPGEEVCFIKTNDSLYTALNFHATICLHYSWQRETFRRPGKREISGASCRRCSERLLPRSGLRHYS